MSLAPSMPMYWDAYLADTTHLSTEEHGAYLLLLAAMWRRNGSVPDDDRDNARIVGLTPAKWRAVKARLSGLLTFADGTITQKNLQKIWKNTQEKIEANRLNGAKGGASRHKKNNDLAQANGSIALKPNPTIPEPEPELSKTTSNEVVVVSHASDTSQAVAAYNLVAERNGWPVVQKMNPQRAKTLKARLADCGGIAGWEVAMRRASESDFLCGRTAKPFFASFDFLTKATNFTRLMEGNYDNRSGNSRPPADDPTLRAIARAASRFDA